MANTNLNAAKAAKKDEETNMDKIGYIIECPNRAVFVYKEGTQEYHSDMAFYVFDDIPRLLHNCGYYYESLSRAGYPYDTSHLCEVRYEKEEEDYRIENIHRACDISVVRVLDIPQIIAALGAKTLPVRRFPTQLAFAGADGSVGDWYDNVFEVWGDVIVMQKGREYKGRKYVLVHADTGVPVDGVQYDQVMLNKNPEWLTLRLGDRYNYINRELVFLRDECGEKEDL